jgi:DNA-binding NarL/FixJ family response regulator
MSGAAGAHNLKRTNEAMPVRSRVVLVERDTLLREGLRAVIQLESDFELVSAVSSGADCIRELPSTRPSLVIADLAFADGRGLEWLAELRRQCAPARVLVLSAFCTNECMRTALAAGALGYVLKDSSRGELLTAMRAVNAGQQHFSEPVSACMLASYLQRGRLGDAGRQITDREREVLTRIAAGESNQQISRSLRVSIKTIEKHRSNLMRKLDLHDTAQVTVFAVRNGLLPPKTFDDSSGGKGNRTS